MPESDEAKEWGWGGPSQRGWRDGLWHQGDEPGQEAGATPLRAGDKG